MRTDSGWHRKDPVRTREYKRQWRLDNRDKVYAHKVLQEGLLRGRVVKKDHCEQCGSTRWVHAHHDDYSRPLDVRWLCTKCHQAWHRANTVRRNPDVPPIQHRLTAEEISLIELSSLPTSVLAEQVHCGVSTVKRIRARMRAA